MRQKIFELKKLVNELESYMYNKNDVKILEIANKICDTSKQITELQKSDKNEENNNKLKLENEKVIDGLEFISSIDFLYKPMGKKNFYEGDYLEKFAAIRTDELKRADVLKIHNKFWIANEIEKGNIFGSIPIDLINSESNKLLISYGWKSINVDIYKNKEFTIKKDLFDLIKKQFENYLLIKEKKNNEYFILDYKI